MDKFLIYDTKEEALAKADEEGKAIGLPYHISSENTTRYAGEIIYTSDEKVALYVTGFTTLTPEEEAQVVTSINI